MDKGAKIIKLKSVSDNADLIRGLMPQMHSPSTTKNPAAGQPSITTEIIKPKRQGRPKKAVAPPAFGAPSSAEQIQANIEQLGEVDKATKDLQEKYYQENLAQTTVADRIALENAPTTIAIKDLQDKVSEIATDKEASTQQRNLERDQARGEKERAKGEKERAKLRSKLVARIEQVQLEVETNDQLSRAMQRETLDKIDEIRQRLANKELDMVEDYEQDLINLNSYETLSKKMAKATDHAELMGRV